MTSRRPIVVLLLALVPGCGGADAPVPVRGSVTWNGDPLPKGKILFLPEDPAVAPDAGDVVNGTFALKVRPGKKRVQLFANRPGPYDPAEKAATQEQYLPARYNTETRLAADVRPGGDNTFDYPLTEKP